MSELKNPVTSSVFATQEDLVESLIESYKRVCAIAYKIKSHEEALLAVMESLGFPTEEPIGGKLSETATVTGKTKSYTVSRRWNIRYNKMTDEGSVEVHPLEKLLEEYPELQDLVNVSYAESGSKIEKLLHTDGLPPATSDAMSMIRQFRVKNKGKPSVEIKVRKQLE